jgi:hypothetical protein
MIMNRAVQPKVNYNFLSRLSNYAPSNYVKSKRMIIRFHLFWIDLSFLSQDIEKLQKHTELFLIERPASYWRFAPIGRRKNSKASFESHDYLRGTIRGWTHRRSALIQLWDSVDDAELLMLSTILIKTFRTRSWVMLNISERGPSRDVCSICFWQIPSERRSELSWSPMRSRLRSAGVPGCLAYIMV